MSDPVVDLAEVEPDILLMRMQDRSSHNAFSDALATGLLNAFDSVASNTTAKAVILTGYDTYFATGGTRKGLLDIHEGRTNFSDTNLYSLALDCRIPVIAAMQGHAIGGGLVMGLFADFIVLSRESVYTTNFMRFGFTPGMGATYITPHKLGPTLGAEMLFLGRNYRGEELKQRGVSFPVLPRVEVYPHALELARSLAQKPRVSLIALKDLLSNPLRARLPLTVKEEVAFHATTFRQQEVGENINRFFGEAP